MKENRRSPRILASVPLEIRAIKAPREALTAVINLHGALILSPVRWPVGTILEIRNPKTNLLMQARVVWSGGKDKPNSYKLGVEFEVPASDFWGADYNLRVTHSV